MSCESDFDVEGVGTDQLRCRVGGEAGECGDGEGEFAGVDVVECEVSLSVGLGLRDEITLESLEADGGSGDGGSRGVENGAADGDEILRK